MATEPTRVAVDIGGTFTDGVLEHGGTGVIRLAKTLTTPADPGVGVATVVAALLEQLGEGAAAGVEEVIHATTLVSNALIERKGARVALLLSRGTRDALEIRRQERYDIYDLSLAFPEPLVTPRRRIEVDERLAVDGAVVTPLTDAEIDRVVAKLATLRPEAVAICLLHSYVDAGHEDRLAAAVARALPGVPISRSSTVAREIREYERMSTTAANAFVQPLSGRYLGELRGRLDRLGIAAPLRIMLSSGGFISATGAAETPVAVLESGPAAGVLSAVNTGQLHGHGHVLAFDMGGTTAKACVAIGGRPAIANDFEVGRVQRFKRGSGLPIVVPSIDLIEIGAGGGSIARVNEMGLLKVGPDSAGAEPGPACYGRGGADPTVTDADLLLGYLDPDYFLGGRMTLSVDAARQATARIAGRLGMATEDVAFGIHNLVCETMAAAARVHIAEKGLDPRRFTMVATGGAGPVHAVEVAAKLGIGRILCSVAAGNGSCLGLLVAPARADRSWSRIQAVDAIDWAALQQVLDGLRADAARELAEAGTPAGAVTWRLAAEMRYVGQGDAVTVDLDDGDLATTVKPRIEAQFAESYRRLYARTVPSATLEAVTWRLTGLGPSAPRRFLADQAAARGTALIGRRRLYLPDRGRYEEVPVYDRYSLPPDSTLDGPAILQEPESTIVVARTARIDVLGDHTVLVTLPTAEGDAP